MGNAAPANPGFVYEGYRLFWQVADLLMQDVEPSQAAWQGLLAAPGYRELLDREFAPDFFPDHFRVAFKPSLGGNLAQVLRGGSYAGLIRHYLHAAETRDHIARGMAAIASAPLADQAREAALAWLPPGFSPDFPTVAFVIFAPDARGFSSVVLDAAFACQLPTPVPMLAHEYHHVFREGLKAPRTPPDPDEADMLWVLDQLETEGIADQIDKRDWPRRVPAGPGRMSEYARRYLEHFAAAPARIRQLDALLTAWRDTPGERKAIGRRLRAAIPLAGHPTGSFMARLIEGRLGRLACVGAVGDPFRFMRLYSAAARAGGMGPALSDAALEAVAALERSCLTA